MRYVAAAVAFVAALAGGATPALGRTLPAHGRTLPALQVISTRADLVTGGDALVAATLPPGVRPSAARVHAGNRDVTSAFAHRKDGRFEGLVSGLPVGRTVLTLRLPGGRGARLAIQNHPLSGPLFAGPQTLPWICTTGANGLGAPLDGACSAAPRYRYVYRSTDPSKPGFQTYDPAHPPADVARTTTDQGRSVPFVVRVETGVEDRGIYTVAALYDPARPWKPWAPQTGWNGKVLWPFGGDCKPWHQQDAPVDPLGINIDPPAVDGVDLGADEAIGSIFGNGNATVALARGFVVADSALNKLGSQCNTVVSAEAIAMLKEHIAETYGPIRYTIGAGASGGSMQQHQIASEYPGLLDGIQPMASFPDIWETVQEAQDCHLLDHYFDATSPQLWAVTAQRDAVDGALVSTGCRTQWDGPRFGTPDVGNYAATWLDPTNAPGCGLPADQVYAKTNPRGVRCTLPDYMVSIFGHRPADGFANRPYDNVGVQYGLDALRSGKITAEQFVDLNAKVGGIDIDWGYQSQRSVADPGALDAAYRGGLISQGRQLAKVPIVDIRGQDNFEIHADFHTYAMRARLERDNGGHQNQVVFTGTRPLVGDPTAFNRAFDLVDRWLGRIEADHAPRSLTRKVRLDRPADAVDTCWIEGRPITDQATCRAAFPYFGDPRIAAGGPLADDVVKCRLRPLQRADYGGVLSDDQWARLRVAFPDGVCDYTRPGVGQRAAQPWMSYADGPSGRPLGAPPRSVSFGPAKSRPGPR
jgi:hypothetical protein